MSDVRLQVIDPQARFSCGGCTKCCTQPYAVLIEQAKAEALLRHDFSAYPQLAGAWLFADSRHAPAGYAVLAKQPGTARCIFLADDGLCIIHKELGAQAKPRNCLKYPYHVSPTYVDDRVSLDFGCPNVQSGTGAALMAQGAEISATCPTSQIPVYREAVVDLCPGVQIPHAAYELLMNRCEQILAEPDATSIWTRFAAILRLLQGAQRERHRVDGDIAAWLRSAADTTTEAETPLRPFESASRAPSPVRMMFAATLLRDVLPPDVTLAMSVWRRVRLLPRLMALAKLSGRYESRFLGREVDVDDVLGHRLEPELDPDATALLARYFRARIWQRFIVGTRLSIVAGIHQHIQDLNAVLFLARAIAQHRCARRLTRDLVAEGLSHVELNIANQPRVFDQKALSWFTGQLDSPHLALESLRLMSLPDRPTGTAAAVAVQEDREAGAGIAVGRAG